MRVEHATPADLDQIRAAYADGRARQAAQGASLWPEFTEQTILAEIDAGNLYRVMDDDAFVGVFSVAYEDPAIWGDDERGTHIYLHRISRVASSPVRGLVDAILEWALAHCASLGRAGLRIDTWGSNDALIAFYESRGFIFLRKRRMGKDPRLLPHYDGLELALLERPVVSAQP